MGFFQQVAHAPDPIEGSAYLMRDPGHEAAFFHVGGMGLLLGKVLFLDCFSQAQDPEDGDGNQYQHRHSYGGEHAPHPGVVHLCFILNPSVQDCIVLIVADGIEGLLHDAGQLRPIATDRHMKVLDTPFGHRDEAKLRQPRRRAI